MVPFKQINLLRNMVCPLMGLIFFGTACTEEKTEKKKPRFKNVVVIVGDDHASTVLGAYGNALINTPNLDRLAENGTLFLNAYANSPLCSASRQSILTGKYPHATGVNLLFTPFNDKTNTTIAEHLKDNDFATALIGKQHFNTWQWAPLYKNGLPSFGFDTLIDKAEYEDWSKAQKPSPIPDSISVFRKGAGDLPDQLAQINPLTLPHPYFDEHAKGTFLANSAIDFIDDHQDERFFLWLAFNEPHAPFAFPIEYAGKYDADDMPLPQGSSEDDRWVPERFKGFTDEQKKGVIASYYTSVDFMDKNVGLVIDALKNKGLYEETLIIYLGDQGYLLNDHKRFEKHTMWQEAIKAPLIIAGGEDRFKGKIIEQPVEFVDIAPFIAETMGVPPMAESQGSSLTPLFDHPEAWQKKYVFAEFLEDNKAMLADRDWKYIFSTGKRDLGQGYETGKGAFGIHHRLYDLKNDSKETTNLAYKEQYREKVAAMQQSMLQHFLKTHPYADEMPDNLNLVGQLVWFCEPRDVGADFGDTPYPVFYPKGQKGL